jgi:superfamily II DNA/RNA helicase
VAPGIVAALTERGIATPFPVQESTIPLGLEGADIWVKAPTGSGKTLAFGIPLIQRAVPGTPSQALILSPTRELARQIGAELEPLAGALGLTLVVAYGGEDLDRQSAAARTAEVIVATPGRLLDLMARRAVSLKGLRSLVLDEADRMLDMGFTPQVKKIVARCPKERQTMLFSATLDGEIRTLAEGLTRHPVKVEAAGQTDEHSDDSRVTHAFVACSGGDREEMVADLIAEAEGRALVFCETRIGTERLYERVIRRGIRAHRIHGEMTQGARQQALAAFTEAPEGVLVATDVAARGIDVADLALVVNADAPQDADAYTHRAGRTGRAGADGRVVTLVAPDVVNDLSRIAVTVGLEEEFRASGLAVAPARTLYARRRGVLTAAPKRTRTVVLPESTSPPTNRVKRGSVRPSVAASPAGEAMPANGTAPVVEEAPADQPRPRNRIKRKSARSTH